MSTTDGVVIRRGQDILGGNVVAVFGPAGHTHYYAHLDQFAAPGLGDRVRPGTVLGTVGSHRQRAPRRRICTTASTPARARSIRIRCSRTNRQSAETDLQRCARTRQSRVATAPPITSA
ncbi:M23 family metallopeptidase [Massilia sp. H-1]|nr:M23 family metallopeptidase [Massilia sp. H-1]